MKECDLVGDAHRRKALSYTQLAGGMRKPWDINAQEWGWKECFNMLRRLRAFHERRAMRRWPCACYE